MIMFSPLSARVPCQKVNIFRKTYCLFRTFLVSLTSFVYINVLLNDDLAMCKNRKHAVNFCINLSDIISSNVLIITVTS